MSALPNCPKCSSEYTYEDGTQYVCPECANEWSMDGSDDQTDDKIVRDSNGNILQNGDTVTVIKDLKVKGSSLVVKVGTRVKGIRLVDGDHDIDCKIPGVGAMKLKSQFVKKQILLIVFFPQQRVRRKRIFTWILQVFQQSYYLFCLLSQLQPDYQIPQPVEED